MNKIQFNLNTWMRWIHIYSAAPVLLSMLFYSWTGLILNRPNFATEQANSISYELNLPTDIVKMNWSDKQSINNALSILQWLNKDHGISGAEFEIEWDEEERLLVLILERPNGQTTVEAYVDEGKTEIFVEEQALQTTLNDLHRGKHVTGIWRLLTDISAICMALFCLSGFWLFFLNHSHRVSSLSWVSIGISLFFFTLFLMH